MLECSIIQISAQEVLPLRSEVLRPHHPLMDSVFPNDLHPLAGHYGALSNASILGIGSVYPEKSPSAELEKRLGHPPLEQETWRLRGMATHESARGQGLGEKILKACIEHVRSRGGLMIWANARTPALGFYRRGGFEVIGEEYTLPGIGPHYLICFTL